MSDLPALTSRPRGLHRSAGLSSAARKGRGAQPPAGAAGSVRRDDVGPVAVFPALPRPDRSGLPRSAPGRNCCATATQATRMPAICWPTASRQPAGSPFSAWRRPVSRRRQRWYGRLRSGSWSRGISPVGGCPWRGRGRSEDEATSGETRILLCLVMLAADAPPRGGADPVRDRPRRWPGVLPCSRSDGRRGWERRCCRRCRRSGTGSVTARTVHAYYLASLMRCAARPADHRRQHRRRAAYRRRAACRWWECSTETRRLPDLKISLPGLSSYATATGRHSAGPAFLSLRRLRRRWTTCCANSLPRRRRAWRS